MFAQTESYVMKMKLLILGQDSDKKKEAREIGMDVDEDREQIQRWWMAEIKRKE